MIVLWLWLFGIVPMSFVFSRWLAKLQIYFNRHLRIDSDDVTAFTLASIGLGVIWPLGFLGFGVWKTFYETVRAPEREREKLKRAQELIAQYENGHVRHSV